MNPTEAYDKRWRALALSLLIPRRIHGALGGLAPDAAAAADSSVGGAAAVAARLEGPAADSLRSAADAASSRGWATQRWWPRRSSWRAP